MDELFQIHISSRCGSQQRGVLSPGSEPAGEVAQLGGKEEVWQSGSRTLSHQNRDASHVTNEVTWVDLKAQRREVLAMLANI